MMRSIWLHAICFVSLVPRSLGQVTGNVTRTPTGDSTPTMAPSVSLAPTPPVPCASEADCSDTQFCGTNDICNPFDCEHWALYAKAFDPETQPGCDVEMLEFCGNDGMCHTYSCQNWYQYGIAEYTAYDEATPTLTCESYTTGQADNANSVIYGCRTWPFGRPVNQAVAYAAFFNRYCTAEPSSGNDFKCYDVDPSTADYNEFLGTVSRLNPESCGGSGAFDQPEFQYLTTVRQDRSGDILETIPGPYTTGSFNPDLAGRTIYATLVTSDAAATDDTTEPADTSGAKKAFSASIATVTFLLMLSLAA